MVRRASARNEVVVHSHCACAEGREIGLCKECSGMQICEKWPVMIRDEHVPQQCKHSASRASARNAGNRRYASVTA